ncbi:SOS response-associated peptidase [Corynebacterium liangguodongii]|uniref:Abasic site processing protein n=1 Tax=Corynebacterium liangguodongii TaxID=2079535 RepID=A0A2S0WD01_9CORY|nr:SOS response-associated peptidase [Corynebacterium liangguodongii]AWB83552.1 DUF159 family protein [Corynebacterium liangguodongii]PWC00358.1 SOS response-associated peptidase [Corynebacterium liangguodongii]
MCGRFVLFTTGNELIDAIAAIPGVDSVAAPDGTPPPRYNVAPTQQVPLVRLKGAQASLNAARWGLIPRWKKDERGAPLFNARAETVAEKPSFRQAFAARRGLMVLDGYYEWKDKVPYFVAPERGMLYAAALWETGGDQLSATMVTTAAAEPMEWLHHRLPLFLLPEEVEQWVHGTPEQAGELLGPSRVAGELRARHAAPEVGNVRNDHAELMGAN